MAQLTYSNPWTQLCQHRGVKSQYPGRERPGATELCCSPKRDCSSKPHCTTRHRRSRERGMEKSWPSMKGSVHGPRGSLQASHRWPCPQGHVPRQGSLGKTARGRDFKGSLQHFGNCNRQKLQLTLGWEPGVETTFAILV